MSNQPLPLTRPISLVTTLSWITALLVAAASLAGLLLPSIFYPAEEFRRAYLTNDVINLIVGLPILLGSMALARKGRLLGLLFWPGAFLYVIYNSIAYAVGMPLTLPFAVNLVLIGLGAYGISLLFSSMDAAGLRERLQGRVVERFNGGALVFFGVLIALLAVSEFAGALGGSSDSTWAELSTRVADLLLAPLCLVCGVLLWRRRPFGYQSALALLFQACMLFVGLLVYFILQPVVAGVPFPVEDFVVVAGMSLVCFIPFGIFVRGVVKK